MSVFQRQKMKPQGDSNTEHARQTIAGGVNIPNVNNILSDIDQLEEQKRAKAKKAAQAREQKQKEESGCWC